MVHQRLGETLTLRVAPPMLPLTLLRGQIYVANYAFAASKLMVQ